MTVDAAFWNNLAERYAAQPVADPDAFDRKIGIVRELLRPDHTVLNVGCGTGSLSLRLADTGADLHGLDLSSEMVRIARDKTASQGVDNVTFHVGPFDDTFTAFDDASLDVAMAFSILHLVPDLDDALALIFRLLKPGGAFVSSTVVLGESFVPYRPMLAVMRWLGKAPMVHIYSKHDLAEAMRRAGFVDVRQRDVGAKAIVGFMTAVKPA